MDTNKIFKNNLSGVEPLTDTGNAEMIARLFGDMIRFDYRRNRWLIWKNHIWQPDPGGNVHQFAKKAARIRYSEASGIDELKERTRVSAWAIQSESKMRLEAAISLARSEKPIADDGTNWDTNLMLLGCQNGVIDLQTGELRNGIPSDRITMQTTVSFDPDAKCPRWEQFINEVFSGNTELIHYIHKCLGYSLTGVTSEQVAFFCYGSGANGKSVLFKAIREILGDYSYNAPATLLQRNQQINSTNDVAATENKRFLVSAETLSTSKLNEQRLKAWTGGDQETARYLYHEYFSFNPSVKCWLYLNHMPGVEDDSYGFWRRVRLIPFNQTFKGEKADINLPETLKSEYEGILAWLVRGCLLWQQEGLNPTPQIVLTTTKDYQVQNDALAEFIYEKCVEGEELMTKSSDMYKAYTQWADSQSLSLKDKLTLTAFGRRMGDKYQRLVTKKGKFYKGVGLGGDGFDPNSSHEVTGLTPISINSFSDLSHEGFYENDPKPVTQPQKPVISQLNKEEVISQWEKGKLTLSNMTNEQREIVKQNLL